jgi:hypothetical protein
MYLSLFCQGFCGKERLLDNFLVVDSWCCKGFCSSVLGCSHNVVFIGLEDSSLFREVRHIIETATRRSFIPSVKFVMNMYVHPSFLSG